MLHLLAALVAAAGAPGWIYSADKDAFTDKVSHNATLESASGKMTILYGCGTDKKLTITFVASTSFGGEYSGGDGLKKTTFDIRAGTRPALNTWIFAYKQAAVAYDGAGPDFRNIEAELLSGEKTMIVRAPLLVGGVPTETFNLTGAKEAIAKVRAGCRS